MKKENRKMAQELRAKERRKKEQRQKLKKILVVAVPVLLAAAFVVAIIVSWQPSSPETAGTAEASETETSSETESRALSLSQDQTLTIEDGDKVNIDYVGTVDGAEFEGGSTDGKGTDLIIGSNRYIDDFEEQLIGHHPGETVSVQVTFPEDYTEELKGKDAVFEVTVNGIYR